MINAVERLNESVSRKFDDMGKKLDGIRQDLECIKSGDCKKDSDKQGEEGKEGKEGDSGKDAESSGGDGKGEDDFSVPIVDSGVTFSPDSFFGSGSGGGVCPRPLLRLF